MEYANEDGPKPKTWSERLRSIGGAILDGLAHPSPYQISLDPTYFRDVHGATGLGGPEANQPPLPDEQL